MDYLFCLHIVNTTYAPLPSTGDLRLLMNNTRGDNSNQILLVYDYRSSLHSQWLFPWSGIFCQVKFTLHNPPSTNSYTKTYLNTY